MEKKRVAGSGRIMALDYLRGFFIAVIIIDHLWRWPNIFQYVTGRGELWVSAAEGFVLISGLLVGYVHGYKKRHLALKPLAGRLVKRGIMLYVWMWITTLLLVALTWTFNPKGGMAYIPVPIGDWHALTKLMLEFNYAHSLTHFLYLYAIYLVLSPIVIWLLRKGLWWVVLGTSLLTYWLGISYQSEWMQWQVLFFVAATIGYHFDHLLATYRNLPGKLRVTIRISAIIAMLGTFFWSAATILPHSPDTYTDPVFTRRPLSFPTVPLAIVWLLGLLSLFTYLMPILERWCGWILTFGQRSLTAYIVHIIPLSLASLIFLPTDGRFWFNSALAVVSIAATWAIMKIPGINRVVPH